MCTPYLRDLKSRLSQLFEFARSTRLKVREIREKNVVDEQREPLFFTVGSVTSQILDQFDDIQEAAVNAALWNSKTSNEVIKEFEDGLKECQSEMQEILMEVAALRTEASVVPGAESLLSPSPQFEELYELLTDESAKSDVEISQMIDKQFTDYCDSEAVRTAMDQRIAEFREVRSKGL